MVEIVETWGPRRFSWNSHRKLGNEKKKKKKIRTYFIMSIALFSIAQTNHNQKKKIETIVFPTSLKWSHSLRAIFFSSIDYKY